MALYYKDTKIKHIYFGNQKIKSIYFGNQKVWSGGSTVRYYDGDRLIGEADVEEGLDVLHPTFSTAKEGYTLNGWQYNGERVENLAANGDDIALYAIYLPNSYNVYVEGSFRDEKYTNGTYSAYVKATTSSGEKSAIFSIDFKEYSSGTVLLRCARNNQGFGWVRFNGNPNYIIGNGETVTYTAINGQNHMTAGVSAGEQQTGETTMFVNRITLTNPRAWT